MNTKNDGEPAHPIALKDAGGYQCGEMGELWQHSGLTKREWFAGMALNEQEISMLRIAYENAHPNCDKYSLAQLRCFHADALLSELAKEG